MSEMTRRKRRVVKRKRKEEGKRRRKEGKIGDQIAKKVRAHLFPLRSRHFLDQSEIRYLEKSKLLSKNKKYPGNSFHA